MIVYRIKRAGRKLVQSIKRLGWIKCRQCKYWEAEPYYPAMGECKLDPERENMQVVTYYDFSCADGIRKLDLTKLQLAWADCKLYGLRLLKLVVWLCRVCALSIAAVGVVGWIHLGSNILYNASPTAAGFLFGAFLYIFGKVVKLC